jgi:UDP-glucose 4-epimerase
VISASYSASCFFEYARKSRIPSALLRPSAAGHDVVSATTPFTRDQLGDVRADAAGVVAGLFPDFEDTYGRLGWCMFPGIDRVYDNAKARSELGWKPRIDFGEVLARLNRNQDVRSALAREVGAKGYHDRAFDDGPYPVRE